ncbi:hypothetical protein [Hymenobacter sp. CRA2]|uniref:hypothetical protein n=1 Tax=Hymenobacter sp. CRA2 TaxID=1955620 RepID=UPI00098FD481|nr:hypothetical protein [Hymenobacter sp. CRA2]OON69796.1 hypothetical protein B0919_07675 [Hymenobacter sp. CRA2]
MPNRYALLAACSLLLSLSGCYIEIEPQTELPVYRPLLMARANLEQAVALVPAQGIHNPGKMYLKGQYAFINERYEGIHIIDNQDPTQPRNIGFLRIPGSLDISMRGNLLYADNAVDLVTLDLSNPTQVRVVSRLRNVFPELAPPEQATIEAGYQPDNRPADAIVVGWQKVNP